MRRLLLACSLLAVAAGAHAQDAATTGDASSGTIAQLLSQGYEIKAAVPNGNRFIVFLQKDKSAYACEFATVAKSRCGSIN